MAPAWPSGSAASNALTKSAADDLLANQRDRIVKFLHTIVEEKGQHRRRVGQGLDALLYQRYGRQKLRSRRHRLRRHSMSLARKGISRTAQVFVGGPADVDPSTTAVLAGKGDRRGVDAVNTESSHCLLRRKDLSNCHRGSSRCWPGSRTSPRAGSRRRCSPRRHGQPAAVVATA